MSCGLQHLLFERLSFCSESFCMVIGGVIGVRTRLLLCPETSGLLGSGTEVTKSVADQFSSVLH